MGFYLDKDICDRIIEFHETGIQYEGVIGCGVQKERKDSIDCALDGSLKIDYIIELQKACDKYIEKYPQCNEYASWSIQENVNIQRYDPPGGGYKVWHTERPSAQSPFGNRHLVFMTYLNDIEEGGETEFYHQKLKVKPEKGLTLIWGVDWTFTHRGLPAPKETKYVTTGWYSFAKS